MADWTKLLTHALTLKSGERLVTLRDAADCATRALQSAHNPHPLNLTITILFQAAKSGTRADREAATDQVALVLEREGLIEVPASPQTQPDYDLDPEHAGNREAGSFSLDESRLRDEHAAPLHGQRAAVWRGRREGGGGHRPITRRSRQ